MSVLQRLDRSLVRPERWWNHMLAPLVGVAALAIGAAPVADPWRDMATIAGLLAAATGLAIFGHIVSELAAESGSGPAEVPRLTLGLSSRWRALLVVASLVLGIAPFAWLPHDALVVSGVLLEIGLVLVYFVRPFGLDRRGRLGAVTRAGFASTVPFLLALATFTSRPGSAEFAWWVPVTLGAWSMVVGLRSALSRQLERAQVDRMDGVRSGVQRRGFASTERFVEMVVSPIEVVASITLLVVASRIARASWLLPFGAAYLAWRLFEVGLLWAEPLLAAALHDRRARVRLAGEVLIDRFVQRWLPLGALIALALHDRRWWVAVVAQLLLFDTAARDLLERDLWAVPDGIRRVLYERADRRDIALVRERREHLVAGGPAADANGPAHEGRWVFVVCGPELHTATLATAIAHLRPLTRHEIWVLTDPARNARPLDGQPGVDRIVEVTTPAHLSDHQASIWLKTSAYRLLPPGEWCYLDSDLVAIDPGIDDIFAPREGPVMFASDLMISTNRIDRFSPWAMTCSCPGMGDDHSCGHLRSQLRQRFGLDVPGDWLHWNGGVFRFGVDSKPVLDLWHRWAIESFAWPEWRTRDQGTLIATVWALGLQDLPRLSSAFNFIVDLGNTDLSLDVERGWAVSPGGPWHHARFLHLYTSALEDPQWNLSRDVEAVALRRTNSRAREARRERPVSDFRIAVRRGIRWLQRLPERVRPGRIATSMARRLGLRPDDAIETVPPDRARWSTPVDPAMAGTAEAASRTADEPVHVR